jgi:membrane protein
VRWDVILRAGATNIDGDGPEEWPRPNRPKEMDGAMKWRALGRVPRDALWSFLEDNGFTLAGALAFYAMLSIAPLLVLLITALGYVGESTHQRVVAQTERLIGPQASEGVQLLLKNAKAQQFQVTVPAIISLAVLVLSATTVFAQLQHSLNHIFNVHTKRGILTGWLYKRFLSLLMVSGLGIVLLASVVISSAIDVVLRGSASIVQSANIIVSSIVFTLVLVFMYRVLPDIQISWKDTWVGGLVSALLLVAGEYAIGRYLSSNGVRSVYGAAGSLVLLLLWVYYSSLIVFFGAELTQAYAQCCGDKISPSRLAEWNTPPG